MIYSVVPRELEIELFERLTSYYADDPNVVVIVDRRSGDRRRHGGFVSSDSRRVLRDRRKVRSVGDFAPDAASH